MAAVSNCEISEVHNMQLEITIANGIYKMILIS